MQPCQNCLMTKRWRRWGTCRHEAFNTRQATDDVIEERRTRDTRHQKPRNSKSKSSTGFISLGGSRRHLLGCSISTTLLYTDIFMFANSAPWTLGLIETTQNFLSFSTRISPGREKQKLAAPPGTLILPISFPPGLQTLTPSPQPL